ncbi:MAG TPA: TetR/AcrR family transcriptional regulator, partial [Acidimicrobiales bacterium]|nr:TetR/AcrR family transcriptional regulator [Acidimicrobiales bacterium]
MGLREEKKQATRAAIVATALDLFRTQGFDRTRIQDVVDRLRISEATFFNYFPTKESVLEAVADDMVERSLGVLDAEVGRSDRPASARLTDVAVAFADQFEGDHAFVALLAGNTRFFLGTRTERFDRALGMLATLFEDGQRAGEIRADVGPTQLAELFLSCTFGTIQAWVHVGAPAPGLRERLTLAASVLIAGSLSTT